LLFLLLPILFQQKYEPNPLFGKMLNTPHP
jgi:hypothetical protein